MTCSNVQIKYAGDGTTVDFTIPFLYQEQSEVKVALWDTTTQKYVSVTEYDGTNLQTAGNYYKWQNATTIRMVNQLGVNDPPPTPTEDTDLDITPDSLLIYRDTDLASMNATFYPGSSVRAQDLNSNFEQLQFAIEESKCDVDNLETDVANNYWNKTTETLRSGDTWVESDDYVVTALRGDERWLSGTPGPGPGINLVNGIGTKVANDSGDIAYNIVPSTFWGQTFPTTNLTGTASSVSGNMTGVGTIQFGAGATYQFPTSDGSAGNVLATDGGGNLVWIIPSGGGGGSDAVIVFDVTALNTSAAGLTPSDTGAIYLVQDSTDINTAASPAVTGLPSAPVGGWNSEIQTTLQWSGTAWTFVRYAAKDPAARYVNVSGDTMTGPLILDGDPTSNLEAATKKYVDDSIPTVPTVNNNKITLAAGTNMSGGGDFLLNQGSDKTITFNAVPAPFEGGEVDGSITTPERTITGTFDLSTGPYWTCGAIDIPNPTNAVSGMAGLIRITGAPTSWGSNFSIAPTPTAIPSIIPFYVQSSTSIRLGQAVGVA